MLTILFAPRASAAIPVQAGPVPGLRIEGNSMRAGDGGTLVAECLDHHWMFGGQKFYRADCKGPVTVNLEGWKGVPKRFGPFDHFSLRDGMAYADRAVFARLNPSNKWYVERLDAECAALVLLPPDR